MRDIHPAISLFLRVVRLLVEQRRPLGRAEACESLAIVIKGATPTATATASSATTTTTASGQVATATATRFALLAGTTRQPCHAPRSNPSPDDHSPVAAACRACYWLGLEPRNLSLLVEDLGVPALLLAALRAILTAPAGYDPCLFSSFASTLSSAGSPRWAYGRSAEQ